MKILMLAPHPFYQERGSPIAVNRLLQVLSERGDTVHLLVYHEGDDIDLPNVHLHRAPAPWFVRRVAPGFSWKKVTCDISMFFSTVRLVSRGGFQLVYAVEESAFIALLLKWFARIPYVYDMDSRLNEQLSEKSRFFALIRPLLRMLERLVISRACMIVPVSNGLLTARDLKCGQETVLLRDVSLLQRSEDDGSPEETTNLRAEICTETARILLYVGNLQSYQGIELMMDSFSIVVRQRHDVDLVIIGGSTGDITRYSGLAKRIGVAPRIHFLGPKPVRHLARYLSQADVLVSPRIKGFNTPMKIYSYLHSGTPCLLTDLFMHRQVASEDIALLAAAEPFAFSNGMITLLDDESLRKKLGNAARRYVEEYHSPEVFSRTANELFNRLDRRLVTGRIR